MITPSTSGHRVPVARRPRRYILRRSIRRVNLSAFQLAAGASSAAANKLSGGDSGCEPVRDFLNTPAAFTCVPRWPPFSGRFGIHGLGGFTDRWMGRSSLLFLGLLPKLFSNSISTPARSAVHEPKERKFLDIRSAGACPRETRTVGCVAEVVGLRLYCRDRCCTSQRQSCGKRGCPPLFTCSLSRYILRAL